MVLILCIFKPKLNGLWVGGMVLEECTQVV